MRPTARIGSWDPRGFPRNCWSLARSPVTANNGLLSLALSSRGGEGTEAAACGRGDACKEQRGHSKTLRNALGSWKVGVTSQTEAWPFQPPLVGYRRFCGNLLHRQMEG